MTFAELAAVADQLREDAEHGTAQLLVELEKLIGAATRLRELKEDAA